MTGYACPEMKAKHHLMTTPETKYAFDLSNDGVSLWHRDNGRTWKLLGKVALSAESFSEDIEKLKTGQPLNADGKLIAQIRIPNSEVFASDINLNGVKDDKIQQEVNAFLTRNTPYTADDLIFDLANEPDKDIAYVAAISKETINEARDFITGYGFIAAYYTTKLDKGDFPRRPRFHDTDNLVVIPSSPPPPKAAPAPPKPEPSKEFTLVPPKITPAVSKNATDNAVLPAKDTTSLQDKKPQTAKDTTDLSRFETVRSKALKTADKPTSKTTQTTPPPPRSQLQAPRRISIEMPIPEKTAEPKKATRVIAPIKMPQSTAIHTNVRGLFSPRHILLLLALILLGLIYWFYSVLIDGKDEITLLQQIPDTPPIIIATPQSLVQKLSNDKIPYIGNNQITATSQGPIAKPAIKLTTPKPAILVEQTAPFTAPLNPNGQAAVTSETTTAELLQNPVATALVTKPAPVSIEPGTPIVEQTALAPLVPTKEGTPGAEGITLFLGQPDFTPPHREQMNISRDPLKGILPKMRSKEFEENNKSEAILEPATQITTESSSEIDTAQLQATVPPAEDQATPDILALADPALKNKLPKPRLASLSRQAEDLRNSLVVRADPTLASSKPKARPSNLNIPASPIEIAIQQAVAETARPRARPRSLKNTIARAKASGADIQTASTGNSRSLTSNPSPVNIQKEATEKTRFNKKRISLVGVYGTASSRRALVRMPSGRYVKVKPGQKFAGWKVSAIGESSVRITKGSRNQVLRMPK